MQDTLTWCVLIDKDMVWWLRSEKQSRSMELLSQPSEPHWKRYILLVVQISQPILITILITSNYIGCFWK